MSGIARALGEGMANVKKISQRVVASLIMASGFAMNCASPVDDEAAATAAALDEEDETCEPEDDAGSIPSDAAAPLDASPPRVDAGGATTDAGRTGVTPVDAGAGDAGRIKPMIPPPKRPCRCKATSARLAETPTESCTDDGSSKAACLGGKDKLNIKCDCASVCPRMDATYVYDFGGCTWESTGDSSSAGQCKPKSTTIETPLLGAAMALRYCGQACRRR